MSVIAEFSRRNVFKVAFAYAAISWLLIQIVTAIEEPLGLPGWFDTLIIVLLIIGFPVATVFAWIFEITPDGIMKSADVPVGESIAPVTRQRLNYAIIGVLLLAVVFLVVDDYFTPAEPGPSASETVEPSRSAATADTEAPANNETETIAVLPFESFVDDAEQQAFADGLTEEVLNSLAQIDNLRVTARTSSFAFKDSNQTIREIAAALGVQHVLEGSVRKSGDTIRVTAQLIRARDDSHLWSESFDRDLQDIFLIQEEIARAVAEVLEIALGVGELGARPGMTRDIGAYELYLQALQQPGFFNDTERTVRATVTLLEQAIGVDPNFALAWLGISRTYFQAIPLAPNISADVSAEWATNSARALERALELAPDSVEIAAYAATQALQRGDWSESLRLLSVMLDNTSNGAFESTVQSIYGQFLKSTGSPRAAIRGLERARTLDPLDGATALQLGDAYLIAGQFEAALDEFDRGLNLPTSPRPLLLGSSLLAALGTEDRARIEERLDLMAANPDPATEINLAMGAFLDVPESAIAEIQGLLTQAENPSRLLLVVAANWAAQYGDAEYALELLRRVPLPVENWVAANQIWRPGLKDVRALPGFRELLADMNLVEFWRESGWPEMCEPSTDNDFVCR